MTPRSTSIPILTALLLALVVASWLTPRVRGAARRLDILDRPRPPLKAHQQPVAYLGGIAVYLSLILTLSVVSEFRGEILGLLLGATLMVMLGLFDDLKAISPGAKLAGQGVAVWVTLRSGIVIELVALPPSVALVLSALWIVTITNAFNIIDVSDGLASATGASAAFWFGVIAWSLGETAIAIPCFALAGASFGFLRCNWPAATIYLGDAGSLLIGFLLGCLALLGSYTSNTVFAAATPMMILSVPLFDLTLVSIARLARGRSPLRGSQDHLAIRLKARGITSSAIALASTTVTHGAGALSLIIIGSEADVAGVILGGYAAAFVVTLVLIYFLFPAPNDETRQAPDAVISA